MKNAAKAAQAAMSASKGKIAPTESAQANKMYDIALELEQAGKIKEAQVFYQRSADFSKAAREKAAAAKIADIGNKADVNALGKGIIKKNDPVIIETPGGRAVQGVQGTIGVPGSAKPSAKETLKRLVNE